MMRLYIAAFFVLLLSIIGCRNPSPEIGNTGALHAQIDSLIEAKDYFTAKAMFNGQRARLPEFHQLKIGMFLDNVFNKADSSVIKMEEIFTRYADEISDSLKYELLAIASTNYSKQYEYKKAKEAAEEVLSKFSHFMTVEKKEDLENTLIIWKALQDQPKQEIVINEDVELEIINDKAGLKNLTVTKDNVHVDFVFDTGANFSTITESTARQFGLHILEGDFDVLSITGEQIKSRIAVAPELSLGSITVKNAVFLVFPDTALAFPQIDYQINGILGFPVIEGLREIQITKDGRLMVPLRPASSNIKNLAIDFLTPLIYLKDERGEGIYTFDTGATHSMLYSTYFEKNEEALAKRYAETDINLGGAGGHITKRGMYVTFQPEVNGSHLSIDSVMVLKEPIKPDNSYLGNIGQDLISQFDRMTINFQDMYVKFE